MQKVVNSLSPHAMTIYCTSCAAEQVLELLQCAQHQPHLCPPSRAKLSVGKGITVHPVAQIDSYLPVPLGYGGLSKQLYPCVSKRCAQALHPLQALECKHVLSCQDSGSSVSSTSVASVRRRSAMGSMTFTPSTTHSHPSRTSMR